MLTLAYQHEVQLRQMRVTTANHVRRALRDPWWTLSLITQAVTFVLVNASLQNTKVSVSCHTCCDGCRFALEFGKHASSFCQRIAGWKIALEGKKKKAHKPKKRSSMDVLHGVHDEASNAISSVPPTGTSVEILSLLDYTVYLTFSSGSFRGWPESTHSWRTEVCRQAAEY